MFLDAEAHRIDIFISHSSHPLICPKTGKAGRLYDHCKEPSWRHVGWFQFHCYACPLPRTSGQVFRVIFLLDSVVLQFRGGTRDAGRGFMIAGLKAARAARILQWQHLLF